MTAHSGDRGRGRPSATETTGGGPAEGRALSGIPRVGARRAQGPAEQAFRLGFAHAPVAMAVVTGEVHTVVYANAAFYDLPLAGDARHVVVGAPLAAAFPAPAARALLGMLVAVLDGVRETGQPRRGTLAATPGGRPGDASEADALGAGDIGDDVWPCLAWPVAGVGDRPTTERIVVVVDATRAAARDRAQHRILTERVLLSAFREEARADAADVARTAAEDANAARGRLLAATSHDLRTPLQAIGGYAELLDLGLRGPVTEGQREALARIQQAMRHLLGLTTTLLDQAQLEAGRVAYALTVIPVTVALHEAAALVAPQAAAKTITLTVAPCEPGLAVRADAGRLRQVLVNLLANAVKFTEPGGTVTVACAVVLGAAPAGAAARVAIGVADTGCGIAPDQLATVFDPYVQVDRRRVTREGGDAGVGLGLAISRDFARGMGGELTAESTVGVGSAFTLTLPSAAAP